MSNSAELTIIGFDLGHSETAVARTNESSSAEPEPIPLAGAERGRPLLSLLGVRPDGTVLVGQDASTARPPIDVYIGFKTADLESETASRPVRLFVEAVVRDITSRGHIPAQGNALWVFGVPSGWSAEAAERYTALLKEVVPDNVKVVSESRAALLYSRECGEVKLESSQLHRPILIVDMGSSTTDYTAVQSLSSSPVDHGNIKLGASLIDTEIKRLVMRRGDLQPAAVEVLNTCPSEVERLELVCRRAKEAYFSATADVAQDPEAERGVSARLFPPTGRPVGVDVYLTKSDMDEVLSTPLEALGGRTWPAALRADLRAALDSLNAPPDLLLLTGGPSQMAFVLDICREVVGPERVVVGSAPEFAIARGLALAGREEVRTEGFRRDVNRLMRSTEIPSMVSERLPLLAQAIGELITAGMTERHVIPMFLKWRAGEIETLNSMTMQIGESINSEVLGADRSKLDGLVADWQNDIHIHLEQKTRPICERWGIPATAMSLPHVKLATEKLAAPVDTSVVTAALEKVGTAVSAIVAVVVANLLLGAGAAVLIHTGPFAVLFAAVFLFGGAMVGKDAVMKKAMTVNIPIWTRKMALSDATIERKIRAKSATSEAELADGIAGKIVESGPAMAADIAREISKGLEGRAREAELLILPAEVKEVKRRRDGKNVTSLPDPSAGPDAAGGRHERSGGGLRSGKDASKSSGGSETAMSQRRDTSGKRQRSADGKFRLQTPAELPDFAQVGGMNELKAELSETVGLRLSFGEEAEAFRIAFNGVLLHGPTGTGKTFLAKATAGEFGINFVQVGVAELMSKFAGESAQNVAAAFAYAAANVPCLLLFDEFDSVAARRDDEPSEENRRVVNQLLTSLEQYRPLRDLIVMATTNDIDRLDAAAVRPGRFDRRVRIDLPDLAARTAILGAQLENRPTAPDLNAEQVARRSEGATAAALAAIVEDAAMAAFRETIAHGTQVPITTAHLLGAFTARGGKDRPTIEAWSWERLVLDEATLTELRQLQLLLEDPDRAAAFGVEPPSGLLLAGPPGTGKTTIARVLAAESRCSFYPTTATDLTSKWVGESEAKVARMFARARDNAPSIVFIDEIDGVGAARGELGGGWADRLLNQLLAEIDGLASRTRVLVIGATNRPDILDPALTRGGRLSRTIWISLPDLAARKRLLELHAARMPLDRVDLDRLAVLTETLSGADLAALCQQAAVAAMTRTASRAARPAEPQVTMVDFEAALTTLQRSRQRLPAQRQDASMAQFLDALSGVRNSPQTTER